MDYREVNRKWYSSFCEKEMEFTLILNDENGDDVEYLIPAHYTVCNTCEGKGSHVNPAIDSHGLSREDFDDDPDFAEDYFAGRYDIPCNECRGKRVSPDINWDSLKPEIRKVVEDHIEDFYAYQAECDYERRMGC